MKPEFWGKMLPHLFSADWYIGGWALLTGVLLFVVRLKARDVSHWFSESPSARSLNTLISARRRLSIFYTLFTTFISIFPLLGMFGTVQALVGLDLTGEMDGVKQHFFEALTSTAWGIIFIPPPLNLQLPMERLMMLSSKIRFPSTVICTCWHLNDRML